MSGGSTAIILAHHALTFNFRVPSASSPNVIFIKNYLYLKVKGEIKLIISIYN